MLHLKLQWAGKCPKHPRYNGRDPGAVKAGCRHCQNLAAVFSAAAAMDTRIEQFEIARDNAAARGEWLDFGERRPA